MATAVSFIHSLVVSFAPFCPARLPLPLPVYVCVCVLPVRVGSGYGYAPVAPGHVALPLNMLVTSTLKHKLRFTLASSVVATHF